MGFYCLTRRKPKKRKPTVGLLSTDKELKAYLSPPKKQTVGLLDIAYEKLKTKHKKMIGGLLDEPTGSN
jgi:hypothetical protein|tara:strand:+ start:110 stop:316 length:207 start_codon:yes stop_codon:yes gene_type:complete